jgi:hypothetical protein
MPVKIIPIPYINNVRPLPHVSGPRIGVNETQFGFPTYESRLAYGVEGFSSDSIKEMQDRWKGNSEASTCNCGTDNGLSSFPRQPPAPGPYYPNGEDVF